MNIPLNIDWQQILLHLFNFLLLFAILYFLLYKPVKAFIDKRAKYYKDMDEQANGRLADAEMLRKEYEEKLSAVDIEIERKKEEAKKQLAEERSTQTAKAKAEADSLIKKAVFEAEQEKEKIIAEANGQISDIMSAAAEKLVFSGTSQAYDKFLDSIEGSADDE